jgi:type I restriction enzyme, S subunit
MSIWETTNLADESCFEYLNGLWKGKKPPFEKATVIRNTNFRNDGILDLDNVAVLDVEAKQLKDRRLQRGDIIIERSGGGPKQPVGRVCYFNLEERRPYSFSNFTTTLRVKDTKAFLPLFVHYYLLHLYNTGYTVPLQRATTGIRNLDFTAYMQTDVPRPPKREQAQIAAVLWKLQCAVEVEENLIASARELKQSAMRQVFTAGVRGESLKETDIGPLPKSWRCVPLEELREFLQYGTSAKCDYGKKGNPVIRIPNILDGKVDCEDLKWCELSKKEIDSLVLKSGDVLFIRTNGVRERVGTCAVYRGQPEHSLFASYLIRARLKVDELNPDFFQYFTSTEVGISLLGGRASAAADGKFNVNTKTIDSILVPLPKPEEQLEIVSILQTIDSKISMHGHKLGTLRELFKTLLHQLITGRVRVDNLDIDVSEITL